LDENTSNLQTVIGLLRKGPDSDAAAVPSRLRVGDSISSIIQELECSLGSPLATSRALVNRSPSQSQGHGIGMQGDVPNYLRFGKIFDR
jgi:hypothetical protein